MAKKTKPAARAASVKSRKASERAAAKTKDGEARKRLLKEAK